jgi:hypothetical protein
MSTDPATQSSSAKDEVIRGALRTLTTFPDFAGDTEPDMAEARRPNQLRRANRPSTQHPRHTDKSVRKSRRPP